MDATKKVYPRFEYLSILTKFAGILGVVQSVIWIGFAMTGILTYFCIIFDFTSIKPNENIAEISRLTFFETYFRGSCDSTNDYEKLFDSSNLHEMVLLQPEHINICLFIYLVLGVLWFGSSIALLRLIDANNLRQTNIILYIWIFVILDIMALDLALGVIFGIDYDKLLEKSFEVDAKDGIDAVIIGSARVTAITMLVIAMKGFILWILNVCLAIYFFVETFNINEFAVSQASLVQMDFVSETSSEHKSTIKAFEFSNPYRKPLVYINTEALERANKLSKIGLMERFANRQNHNPDRFRPYGSRWEPSVPDPDYTPPMPRSNIFQNNNFHSNENGNTRF